MKDKNNPISILIPDGESHLLIFVIDCLSEIEGLKIYIMSDKPSIPMRFSRHIHHFSYYPKTDNAVEWIGNINKELEKFSIDVILPVFEIGIRKLIENKEYLNSIEKLVSLASLSSYDTAIDKWNLAQHMVKENIPCPKTWLVDFKNSSNHVDYPFIVKPTKGFGGGMRVKLIQNQIEWKNFILENANTNDKYLAQEFIKGDDYCCNVLCLNGEVKYYTIQKGIRWGRNRFSAQTGYKFLEQKEVLRVGTKLMKSLNWSGIACIDLKFDEHNNSFKVIEINTRFWSSLMGSLAAGVNFPYRAVELHLNEAEGNNEYNSVEYLSLKGVVDYIREDFSRVFHFSYIWNTSPLKYALKDPLPMIYKFFVRYKVILMNKLKKPS